MQTDKNTHIHAHTASQTNKPGVRNNQSNNKIKKTSNFERKQFF